MEYRDIELQIAEGVATVTLNRPEQLNTFTGRMGEELEHAYRRCDEDDLVRAVVLTGAGRAFCAGADMSEAAATFESQEANADFSAAAVGFPAFRIRKLVIAAVNGHAIGVGLTLALQADLRLFAREGKYGVVQVRRGVMPDAYSHWTLPRLVGLARAAEILLTGHTFRGDEILPLGIASRVLPANEVLAAALELARDTAVNAAPLSVAISKRLLWESLELGPDDVERKETALHHVLMGAPDAIEGPVAFMQKRAPEWKQRVSRDWPDWPE
ncbi:MAG: crotonase [Deltaproteobacteria bacterium]|nr:crotonase [Deltaproteobacteria bacterium]